MYVKNGLLTKARQVFDGLPVRNVVSWNALIGGYAEDDRSKEALHCFNQMQEEGISANSVTFISCLKACCNSRDTKKGHMIHNVIEKRGLLGMDITVSNALVDMYAKCGQLTEAEFVLRKLSVRNAMTWTSLISGYVEHGYYEIALNCFDQMQKQCVPATAVTYASVLKACSNLGDEERGQEIHRKLEASGLLEGNFILGSALVNMYVKCGLYAKAHSIFDRITIRNIGCWNSLMTAYGDNGLDEDVLVYYEQMKLEGVSPNHVTFICTLKACGNVLNIQKGKEIHNDTQGNGLLEDSLIGNAVVEMYTKLSLLTIARQVFDYLPIHTMVSWNALIAGYTEHGYGRKALECFELMQIEGCSPMPVTFVYMLKACGITHDRDRGKELHAEIERQGLLDSNIVIGNALIDMYSRLGLLFSSLEVFDRLPARDVVTWSVLIAGYLECGLAKEALIEFEQMQSDGVTANAVTYNFVLKACCMSQNFVKGMELHAEMERQGLIESNGLFGANLISLYSRSGSLAKAEEVLKRLPVLTTGTWNALVATHAEHGDHEKAMHAVDQMQLEGISLQEETFMHLLKSCATSGSISDGDKLYAAIEENGFLDGDAILGVAVVDMYAKCGSLQRAQEVFNKFTDGGIVLWTALIAGYCDHGHSEQALRLYGRMHIEGVLHDAFTAVNGLKACRNSSAAHKGKQIHVEINEQGLLVTDIVLGNALTDMYARCGQLAMAHHVLTELPSRSVISWTSLIAGYANHGYGERALECFKQMCIEGFAPSNVTFVCCLRACGEVGCIEIGSVLHAEIERQGLVDRDLTIGNAVVDMYARCGRLIEAQQVFEKLRAHTIVSWTTIMAGYAKVGEGGKVFQLFRRMQKEGLQPNEVTFVVMLTACIRMGLFHKGHTFFEAMSKDYGILPMPEHYTCVASLLIQAGHPDRVLSIRSNLATDIDLMLCHGLLFSCKNWGHVALGKYIFEQSTDAEAKMTAFMQ
ncbi:hypothetical protein KP509_11G041000 [Ceratopteris richardii]|nr:hypothetical protein KP509_11G041000 [Ceratopteris richardii]